MAKNVAETVFTGDAAGLVAAYDDIREQNRKLEQQNREQAAAQRAAHREETQSLREAARMYDEVRTPAERYKSEVEKIEKAYESGAIDQETYNRQLAKQRESLDAASDSTGMLDGKLSAMIPTLATLAGALTKAWQEQARLREEAEATALAMDELTRKYQVQAGLSSLEAGDAREAILKTALANATDKETAFAASTQLVSSGFERPEQSGTLDAFLKILASSNKAGENPEATAIGMGQFLQAFGLEKNAANLMDLGVRGRGMFSQTDMQVTDMSAFSKAAPVFAAAGLSVEDTISGLGILRETMAAPEAATHGRNIVSTLMTAGGDKGRTEVLKSMGLKPEQLDFVGEGESLPEVLAVLRKGVQSLPEEQQAPALSKLFGRESTPAAMTMLDNLDKFEEFRKLQNDRVGFVAGVNTAQSGPNAALRRAEVKQTLLELQDEREATRRAVSGKILDNEQLENYQASGFVGDVTLGTANAMVETAVWMGADPATFLSPEGLREVESFGQSNFSVQQLDRQVKDSTDLAPVVEELQQLRADLAERDGKPLRVENANPQPPAAAQSR